MSRPVVAFLYDFDKTLSPKDMQEYGFIDAIGMEPEAFWQEVHQLETTWKMDNILAYMYLMLEKSRQQGIVLRRSLFHELGAGVALFPVWLIGSRE